METQTNVVGTAMVSTEVSFSVSVQQWRNAKEELRRQYIERHGSHHRWYQSDTGARKTAEDDSTSDRLVLLHLLESSAIVLDPKLSEIEESFTTHTVTSTVTSTAPCASEDYSRIKEREELEHIDYE